MTDAFIYAINTKSVKFNLKYWLQNKYVFVTLYHSDETCAIAVRHIICPVPKHAPVFTFLLTAALAFGRNNRFLNE